MIIIAVHCSISNNTSQQNTDNICPLSSTMNPKMVASLMEGNNKPDQYDQNILLRFQYFSEGNGVKENV